VLYFNYIILYSFKGFRGKYYGLPVLIIILKEQNDHEEESI